MKAEGGVHFERQGLPPRSLILRVKATALLCSLNILALPAQDEPTCICGRGCRKLSLDCCFNPSAPACNALDRPLRAFGAGPNGLISPTCGRTLVGILGGD
jgi:hypothetical protein